jgi:hypothetical protein
LRRHSKGVCHAVEECKQGDDVNGFRNLVFCPAYAAQVLDIFSGRSISRIGDQLYIAKKCPLRIRELRFLQLALKDCANCFIGSSLNPQEV